MKLSNQQALILFEIAKWTTRIHGGVSGYSSETIVKLVNDIVNQQNNEPKELEITVNETQ